MDPIPEELRYTQDHEWVSLKAEGTVRVGITHFAQSQLGDVVYIELPQVGESRAAGDQVGLVESTKSVSEVYAPVGGKMVACNEALENDPELVNTDPYGEGWMIEIQLSDPAELDALMTAEDYRRLTDQA